MTVSPQPQNMRGKTQGARSEQNQPLVKTGNERDCIIAIAEDVS